MITVKIVCDTGNAWFTRFRGTFAEAETYFLWDKFTRESDDGREVTDRCIAVTLV